jgi:hypothetical protein
MTANRITLSAKESVTINGGGSYTVWNAGAIKSGTTGPHVAHAVTHGGPGAKSVPVNVAPSHVVVPGPQSLRFAAVGSDDAMKLAGYAGQQYSLINAEGRIAASGTVSSGGTIERYLSENQEQLTLFIGSTTVSFVEAENNNAAPGTMPSVETIDPVIEDEEYLSILHASSYYQATASANQSEEFLTSSQLSAMAGISKGNNKIFGAFYE